MSTVALITNNTMCRTTRQLPTQARTCCLRCRHVLARTGFESHLVRLRDGREYDVVALAGKRVQIGKPNLPSILAEARNRSPSTSHC